MNNKKSKALIFANIILGSTVILLILIIIYLWYKSSSLQITINSKSGVILTAGLLFSIITLYLRDSWKINVAIVLLSTVVAAYSLEFVLLATNDDQLLKTDKRTKLEVIEDMRAEGIDAWPQVIAWLFTESNGLPSRDSRVFPLGGISQKTIVYCNETGDYKIFKSDEHGFNNPHGTYSVNDIKAVLLGDSFTIGSCVMKGEDIASQLRDRGISALNLGNGGNGPLIELALLKEYVDPIKPEIVLWIYYEGNDLLDLERERKASMLMRYLEDDYSQNLLKRQDEIDAAMIKYINSQWIKKQDLHQTIPQQDEEKRMRENRSLLKVIKLWYLRSRIGLVDTQKPVRKVTFKTQLSLFSEILTAAYQRTSGWGGKFYFVYLPTMERYTNDNYNGSFYDRDDVLGIVHKLGIPLIDFHEVLDRHPDPLSLTPYLGAHYNADGYKLVSEYIVNQLRKDRLILKE